MSENKDSHSLDATVSTTGPSGDGSSRQNPNESNNSTRTSEAAKEEKRSETKDESSLNSLSTLKDTSQIKSDDTSDEHGKSQSSTDSISNSPKQKKKKRGSLKRKKSDLEDSDSRKAKQSATGSNSSTSQADNSNEMETMECETQETGESLLKNNPFSALLKSNETSGTKTGEKSEQMGADNKPEDSKEDASLEETTQNVQQSAEKDNLSPLGNESETPIAKNSEVPKHLPRKDVGKKSKQKVADNKPDSKEATILMKSTQNVQRSTNNDSSVLVRFHVLVKNMDLRENKTCVVFGPPFGKWDSPFPLEPLNKEPIYVSGMLSYFYFSTTIHFDEKFCGKAIPYKYILLKSESLNKSWEEFYEDPVGDKLNRVLVVPHKPCDLFNKYDDVLSTNRYNHLDHSAGRYNAFAIMTAYLFKDLQFEKSIESILRLYKAQASQQLVNSEMKSTPFGSKFLPKWMIYRCVKHLVNLYKNKCPIVYCKVSLLISVMFAEFNAPEDRREYYDSIFDGFREFLDRYNDDQSIFDEHFSFTQDFLPRVVKSVVDVINDNLIIMAERRSMRGDIVWIYAYRFIRKIQGNLNDDSQIKFELWEKICQEKSVNINFQPILKSIHNSQAEQDSFKHEFLKLASGSHFRDLILSEDIALFDPMEISKKLLQLCESESLTDTILNNLLPKLLRYYRFSMDSIKQTDVILFISIIGSLPTKCKKLSVCNFSLDVLQEIFNMKKDLEDNDVILEYQQEVQCICNILSEECANVRTASVAAKEWTNLFNRLETLNTNTTCIDNMRQRFERHAKNWDIKKCLDVLTAEFQNLSPHVNEFLINVIFDAGSFALHSTSSVFQRFLETIKFKDTPEKYLKNLGQLISKIILALPISYKANDSYEVLYAITDKPHFIQIVKYYDAFKQFINADAQTCIKHIYINMDLFLDNLKNGSLPLSSIRMLTDERRQHVFLELFEIKSKRYNVLVKKRIEELNCVVENQQKAKLFLKYFQDNTKCDLFEQEGYISFTEENTSLNKVCQVRKDADTSRYQPPNLSFQFSNEDLLLMNNFMNYRKSKCFVKMINQVVKNQITDGWLFQDVINTAREIVNEFQAFCARLSTGKIPLVEIKNYFNRMKDVLEIHQELAAIDRLNATSEDWLANIESKIKLFLKMNELKEIASTLSETVGNLNIDGQLGALDRIVELASTTDRMLQKPLSYLTEEIMQFGSLFSKWNRFVLPALKTFNTCTGLVKWIRENIKSTQEFKVFIDLANISAGESDIEVDRVICFQSSVTAYYSLLFDCKNNIKLEQLLDAVNSLNSNLERDPKIPDKFISSNRYIGWIKLVKERHGSVETSSLNMVKQINRTGHFNLISKEDTIDENFIEVTLTYSETVDQENYEKCVTLKSLIELESKLMLISVNSEMQSEVDRFLKILHNVDLIQKELCKLIVQGCCLFSEFSITIYMGKKEVSLSVDFGHKTGILRGTGRVDEELSMLIVFLEKSKSQWQKYMTDLRGSVPELNIFTSDQLVCLSKFLADLESKGSVKHAHEAMMLMNSISQEIVLQDIKNALNDITREEVVSDEAMSTISEENKIPGEVSNSATNDEYFQIRQSIHDEYGFDFDHISLAMRKVVSLNEDLIAQWCLANPLEDVPSDVDMSEDDLEDEVESPLPQQSEEQDILDFINKVAEDYGLPDTFVFAAILSTGNINDDSVVASWCFDNIEQHEEIDLQKLVDYGILSHLDTTAGSGVMKSASHDIPMDCDPVVTSQSLQCKLFGIWNKFLQSNNVTKADDFVSFQKLATVVDQLANKFSRVIDRKFLPCLKEGQPNLIIVKNNVIYESALMIYQYDKCKPLPSVNEILICDTNTTEETLILHCSKAFNDTNKKIFTVIHADKISFHNGNALEKLLKTAVQNHHYRLIFLSSKETDDSSYISTLLQKNKVSDFPDVRNQYDDLRSYVYLHLQNANPVDPTMSRFRIIASNRSGDGKSLVADRLSKKKNVPKFTFSVHSDKIDKSKIISSCFKKLDTSNDNSNDNCHIYHFDISPVVHEGERDFLFSIAILKGINDYKGRLWLSSPNDIYIAEITKDMTKNDFFSLFPTIWCKSPKESLLFYQENPKSSTDDFHEEGLLLNHYMDYLTFLSDELQRPYQFLDEFVRCHSLDDFDFQSGNPNGSNIDFLTIFLEHCGIPEPSWKELSNFWNFLNVQLMSCENSHFCDATLIGDTLPTFKRFVVKFLIKMSKDFSTRSAEISDRSFPIPEIPERNRWEQNPHPYLFFNEGGHTISFFGFCIINGDLMDDRSGVIIEKNIMSKGLQKGLSDQKVEFLSQLHTQPQASQRYFYLEQLCMVFGINSVYQFDDDYELTSDNVLKILAIHMRFRAGIPVVIMGETGTGKTRLVRFMCDLQKQGSDRQNMIILKCHGGTQEANVYAKVKQAIKLAEENTRHGIRQTVLFFDEANTTSAIGSIKEVMCDNLVEGEPIPDDIGLKFVAAVNPYREHSSVMIKKLEEAGLGYHMKAENSQDRLGRIPMRRLVYRVKELPLSLVPFIWDFGRLDSAAESKYIYQMIENSFKSTNWSLPNKCLLMELLTACQTFMRRRNDECSFVSLRDVERCLKIIGWFHDKQIILQQIKSKFENSYGELLDDFTLITILAIGCAYYVRLDERETFRQEIELAYNKCQIIVSEDYFQYIIELCQDIFVEELKLQPTISKNEALKENVWIMAICIELRIPLFLVGKPGSSKSLAKTVVSDVMQGDASYSALFKTFKEIQLVSFQCSPLATADGILTTFRQCQKYQEKQDLQKFVSCVVLDEVGLAEDSPKMPLKALHPLLEDGCVDEESPKNFKKVGFVGISNWALDPAKMNRGIYLSRGQLSKEDLKKTALGICDDDDDSMITELESMIEDIVDAYLKVYKEQDREYYGLRDFYSLIKMLCANFKKDQEITTYSLKLSISRCFGGEFGSVKASEIFMSKMKVLMTDPDEIDPRLVIKSALDGQEDSRYLLFLTKNNSALSVLQGNSALMNQKVTIIYGSSFSRDQQYIQLCKNINKIKLSMEVGQTVILCNLTSLYESLYDALNQSYVEMGGSRYVDLGLGIHRVKCRVHELFRLIVVAEDKEVLNKFPIPLLNRLEKHYLGINSLLHDTDHEIVEKLQSWICRFSEVESESSDDDKSRRYTAHDVFIGYHHDVPANLVFHSKESMDMVDEEEILKEAKSILMRCAVPDSLVRLSSSELTSLEKEEAFEEYSRHQQHSSLANFISSHDDRHQSLFQVTTYSRLLTDSSLEMLSQDLDLKKSVLRLIFLQQIETEDYFKQTLRGFLNDCCNKKICGILVIQCHIEFRSRSLNLIECARYIIEELIKEYDCSFSIVLLIRIHRTIGGNFVGFPSSSWIGAHLDELFTTSTQFDINQLKDKPLSDIIEELSCDNLRAMLIQALPRACASNDIMAKHRLIDRIATVRDYLNSDNSNRFLNLIRKLIVQFQGSSETSAESRHWLFRAATSSIYLHEGHTFQESLWLTITDHVEKQLTRLLSFMDAYNGLNHLNVDSVYEWKHAFYMVFLENADFLSEDFTLPINSSAFKGEFPFFWFYFEFFEKLFGPNQDCNTFLTVIHNTKLGELLSDAFMSENGEACDAFATDIVVLTWPITDKHVELRSLIVKQLLSYAAIRLTPSRLEANREIFQDLVQPTDLYLALKNLKDRLSTTIKAVELCDFGVEGLSNFEYESDEHNIDDKAIDVLLSFLEPKNLDIVDNQKLKVWIDKINQLKFIIQNYTQNQKDERKAYLDHQLKRLDLLRLFVQHVIYGFECKDSFRLKLRQFLKRFTIVFTNCDFKLNPTFQSFIEQLISLSEETGKALFCGGIDKCFICLEDLTDPVALPCQHVACFECIKNSIKTRIKRKKWNCPAEKCTQMYKEDFVPKRTTECDEAVSMHRRFRERLNTFFLEVLQLHVFYGEDPPQREIINTLLKFVVAQELPKRKNDSTTKSFGLFSGDCIDSSPIVRSFIFQMLLRGDWAKVDVYLTDIYQSKSKFADNSNLFKAELCLLLVYSMEDSLGGKCSKDIVAPNQTCAYLSSIRKIIQSIPKLHAKSSFMNRLEFIAKVRFCLTNIMHFFNAFVSENRELSREESSILRSLSQLVKTDKHDCIKRFVVRELATKYRTDSISSWKQTGQFLELMPESLRQVDLNYIPDIQILFDKPYIALRNDLNRTLYSENSNEINLNLDKEKNLFFYRLANFYLIAKLNPNNESDQNNIDQLINRENAIGKISTEQKNLSRELVQSMQGNISPRDRSIYTISFFFYEVLHQLQHNQKQIRTISSFFVDLCFATANQANKFFPTMPHNDDVEARNAVSDITRLYYCPNGHAYGVGDCGQLNGSSICPTCKATIGRGQANPRDAQLQDTTEHGYVLGAATSPNLTRVRSLDNSQVAIVRFLVHSAMFVSQNKAAVSAIVKDPNVDGHFLLENMRLNLAQLATALGKSEDHAQILLHSVIRRILSDKNRTDRSLVSKQARTEWEASLSQIVLQPSIAELDRTYQQYQTALTIDQNAGQNIILEILQKKEPFESFNLDHLPYLPHLWIPRHQITLENISTRYALDKLKEECPLFTILLENRFDLQHLRNLIPIIKLQIILVSKFNRKLDPADLEGKSIRKFLFDHIKNTSEREELKRLIEVYLSTFNKLRDQIFKFDQSADAASKHYYTEHAKGQAATINFSPCGMIFPDLYGHSLIATVTVQFLLDKHNSTLRRYKELTDSSVQTVPPSDIDLCHLVDLQIEELSMLLLNNCRYTLQPGKSTKPELDLQNLERQIISRYFIGRTLVDPKQAPKLQLIQEEEGVTGKSTFTIDQILLPEYLHRQIEASVSSSPGDVSMIMTHCITIRKLLSFTNISSLDLNPSDLLTNVMKQLHIAIPEHLLSSRFLDNICLTHLDDFILFLKVLRAKLMLMYKQNPWYGFLDLEMQVGLTAPLKENLLDILNHMQPYQLLSRLYRFMEALVSTKRASADFQLGESIYWYLYEFIDGEVDKFQEYLPQEILVKHCASCFNYFVEQIDAD